MAQSIVCSYLYSAFPRVSQTETFQSEAGKNLRFLKTVFKLFRFFRFSGFNVYAQSHAEHWTQEYDQLKSYRPTQWRIQEFRKGGPKGELRCKNGHEIKSAERRRRVASCRQRILEHLRSNEASFGNIFK